MKKNNKQTQYIFKPTGLDYVNENAIVVIVGITPGPSQLEGSKTGLSPQEYKRTFAFKGAIRKNLIKMLNYIGVNNLLGISSCESLWEDDFNLIEMTSLLKDATFVVTKKGEKGFNKAEKILKSELLLRRMNEGFVKDCKKYGKAKLFVACGEGVYATLNQIKSLGKIKVPVIGIAHPSPNNGLRVSYYQEIDEPSLVWCKQKAEEAKMIVNEL